MFQHFNIRVRHDNGIVTIRTAAQSKESAKSIVMAAERCPERSILSVKVAKPAGRYPAKSELMQRAKANNVECFYVDSETARRNRYDNAQRAKEYGHDIPNAGTPHAGWYYWTCAPGCLPDSDPFGPHASPLAVLRAAYDADFLGE